MENKMLCAMLDCSRNAVMTVKAVKKYADIISKMGYNSLMLYTEDTYEVKNQPFFGHLRGKYSCEELKEIDSYCASVGIELIPCIQALGHLSSIFKWYNVYNEVNDCDNILLAGDEKTYQLIDDMLSSISESFSSKKIHIGMDEAYRVGTGKYQQKNGIKNRFDVINEHLHNVCKICEKYGFEAMIWSDMFCRLALNTENQYELDTDPSKILEKANLPENVSLVYWDYYSDECEHYAKLIRTNKLFGKKLYFANSAGTSRRFAPNIDCSLKNTAAALQACRSEGIDSIICTLWGDDGGDCSLFSALPAVLYTAEMQNDSFDENAMKEKFFSITGCDYDSFMLFAELDKPPGREQAETISRCFFYNDPFMGIRDFRCDFKDGAFYKKLADDIHNAPNKGNFKYLFDFYEKLALALSYKSTLGIRTRKAYLENNLTELNALIADYDKSISTIQDFHEIFEQRWFIENKPHGFDVQDIRLGGLIQRLKSCKKRLTLYCEGKLQSIPELEEPVLYEDNGMSMWEHLVTANNISAADNN